MPGSEHRCFWLITAAAVVGATLLFAIDPSASGLYPPCPFHYLTGLYCPGCGTTRGLHQLLHGNIVKAADHNLLMVLSLPVIGYVWAANLQRALGRKMWPPLPVSTRTVWGFFAVVIVYWVVRNLPFYPFTILAP